MDKTLATTVCDFLESNFCQCWLAPRDIRPGNNWAGEIIKALSTCDSLVLILTSNSNLSSQVHKEVERAIDHGLFMLVFRINDVLPSGPLEYFLSSDQWIDASESNINNGLKNLLYHIENIRNDSDKACLDRRAATKNFPISWGTDSGDGTRFSDSIVSHMDIFNRTVERLTSEQYNVIRQLHGVRRVRISGCAGSGKTLVAAEKANRLSTAGLRTLFLCHSPLLASNIEKMTFGTGVEVHSFGEWIGILLNQVDNNANNSWTNYDEPDSLSLHSAFDILLQTAKYDAVIVDEGQDFRLEWWNVVEAALMVSNQGLLYIFHDDRQAILPHRSQYPFLSPSLDLSKNCRNAGKIYELIQTVNPAAASITPDLLPLGDVFCIIYDESSCTSKITEAIRRILSSRQEVQITALHAGLTPLSSSNLHLSGDHYLDKYDWQSEVRRKFNFISKNVDLNFVKLPVGGTQKINSVLNRLSDLSLPNKNDIHAIVDLACSFRIKPELRKKILNDPIQRLSMTWVVKNEKLALWKRSANYVTPSEMIIHFESDNWGVGIPEAQKICFDNYESATMENIVPTYRVSDFKGLEADAILLNLQGPAPISKEEIYVGISRARMVLGILVDIKILHSLPLPLKSFALGEKMRRSWNKTDKV